MKTEGNIFSNTVRNYVGEEFCKQLTEVIKVRASRKAQYGDTFKEDDMMFLYYQMRNKVKRFGLQIDGHPLKEGAKITNCSTAKDSLLDLICYAVFALINMDRTDRSQDCFSIGVSYVAKEGKTKEGKK